MQVQQGKYTTVAGDVVEIKVEQGNGIWLGQFIEINSGMDNNKHMVHKWNEDGTWCKNPQGIHNLKAPING